MTLLSTLLIVALLDRSWGHYNCPDYPNIRQASVDPSVFDIRDFAGSWYMIATNEPTLPAFCTCGTNEIEVHADDGWYAYTNSELCEGVLNISVPIKGDTSADPESPGYLMENFGAFNHTSQRLDPNMIFNVSYEAEGRMDLALTYACIDTRLYSFNVLSRTNRWSYQDVEDLIAFANASTGGVMNVEKMRIADDSAYLACGMSLH